MTSRSEQSNERDGEAARVREVYRRRVAEGREARYEYWQPDNLYIYQSRERALLSLLRELKLLPLEGKHVLDVGCGDGGVLLDWLHYGAEPSQLHGIDLIKDRVDPAKSRLPGADIRAGDARELPFADGSVDVVLAFTLLSSVLDDGIRAEICREMTRVLRPGGVVLIYDFWVNPFNRAAKALKRDDVKRLFFGREIVFRATTPAPPLVRFFAGKPGGWLVCRMLEVIPFMKTHYIAAIRV